MNGGKKALQRNPREPYAPLRNREAFHCAHSSKSSAGGPKGLSKSPNSMRARGGEGDVPGRLGADGPEQQKIAGTAPQRSLRA